MFSSNERISTRQFKRLLTLELFGVTTVLLPGILCQTVERDGITALLGGLILVFFYTLLLKRVGTCAGRSLQGTLKTQNRLAYEVFLFIMFIQMLLMGVWVLNLAAEMSRDILLQGMDIRLVILTFAFVSVIGAFKGMECRGRMAEVLYLYLLIPFVVLLVLAARKANMDQTPPLLTEPPKMIANGSYEVFIVFQGVTLGFFALPYLKNQTDFFRGVRKSFLLNGLFCFLLMIISICIFGLKGAASQKWLAVNLMTTPDLPGGIMERLDVLMVTIWIVALFFFVSGSIFYGGKMVGRLFHMKKEKSGLSIMTVLIVAGSLLVESRDHAYYIYMNYMKYIGVPLLLVVLIWILWKLRPRKAVSLAAGLLLVWCLTGCAKGVELEDREFVLTLGVDWNGEQAEFYYDTSDMGTDSGSGEGGQTAVKIKTDDFYELRSAYGQQSDKYLDCNHLKAVIIGKGLAADPKRLGEFLEYVETNELFARNVKLFFAEEVEKIFALCPDMNTVLGEYLDNVYIDSSYYVEEQSSTLGDLLGHWHDSEESLLVPVLEDREGRPLIRAYAVVWKTAWTNDLSIAEANLAFLGNGVNVQVELMADKKYAVQLRRTSRELNFISEEPLRAEAVIDIQGEVINEEVKSEKKKREIEKALNKKLEQFYQSVLADTKKLDLLHIYRALGVHNRELWKKYHNNREEFCRDLEITVQIKSNIM
ncbi:MAG: GerAB/ArcD/ProY family transporter [Lachnospiraceae bacterium]|nr:GerAB/ArcD/ProY family transporter [Lachnospiraceae bacterium]